MKPGDQMRWKGGAVTVVQKCDDHEDARTSVDVGGICFCVPTPELEPSPTVPDFVAKPSHYIVGGFECRDVIAALELNFSRGSALKYLWRAGRKHGADEVTDLRKAIECLEDEVRRLGKAGR